MALRALGLAWALGLASLGFGCQKQDDHPPFVAGCERNCNPLPGIAVITGSAGSSSMPSVDAGAGTLTGHVLLLSDDSFVRATPYLQSATVTADGVSGSPVTGTWDGTSPFLLTDVARVATNWVGVRPNLVGGDALSTYWAVPTNAVDNADLGLALGSVMDGIFTAVSSLRSPSLGQVVLFFRSAGTGVATAGVRADLSNRAAQIAAYKSNVATGWTFDDGTTTTDTTGLVLFGNVDSVNAVGTQTVTVVRGTNPAGQFALKVVPGAVTIAILSVAP